MHNYNVHMSCGVEIDDVVYMSSISLNGLFSYNLINDELKYVAPFAKERPRYAIHRAAVKHNDEIWFLPQHGTYIAIYDRKTGKIDYLKPRYKKSFLSPIDNCETICYTYGLINNGVLYILPAGIDSVNFIDMTTRCIHTVGGVVDEGECIVSSMLHKGIIHAFTADGKWRIEIDTVTYEFRRYPWNNIVVADIKWIESIGKYIVTQVDTNQIVLVDESFSEFENVGDYKEKKMMETSYIYIDKDSAYALPAFSKNIVKINIPSLKVDFFPIENISQDYANMIPIKSEEKIFGSSLSINAIISFDKKTHGSAIRYLQTNMSEIIRTAKSYGVNSTQLFCNENHSTISEKNISLEEFISIYI